MATYNPEYTTEQDVDNYSNHYAGSSQADSVSLPTTIHDGQLPNGPIGEAHPNHPHSKTVKGTRRSNVYFSATVLTCFIPLSGMIAWLITVKIQQGGLIFDGFSSAKIGGHLTQTEAKAIDFSCSALLAPLLMAGLNFIWFACARVCVVNEHSPTHLSGHGVPLQSLARASRTSVGTYDIIGLWELFSAKTWRLSVLGTVALLSAISSSALSNIIAYESYDEGGPSPQDYALRTLSDDFIFWNPYFNPYVAGAEIYYRDPTQINVAAHNMSTMLDGLLLENAALDSEGGYIGPNATDLSLDSIEGSVMSLHNVPGYRLTADCIPTTLNKNSMRVLPELGTVQITMSAESPSALAAKLNITDDGVSMNYLWTGSPQDTEFDPSSEFDFVAFDMLVPECVYLIHLGGGAGILDLSLDRSNESLSERTIPTAWGDLSPMYQNFTVPKLLLSGEANYTSYPYKVVTNSYALQCVVLRQEGFLEYMRRDDQKWFVASSRFQDDRTPVSPFLESFQITFSQRRPAPPLGSVLWGGTPAVEACYQRPNLSEECVQYKNFSTAFNNLVYASGEAIRIMYNVAALNTSGDQQNYFYNVTGEIERQFYRITYVPALLLVALLGIIICSLLVTVLVITTMRTWSWKMFRQVDITRLVVDCVGADLAKNGPNFTRLGRASDYELADWAGRYRIAYEKVIDLQDDDGHVPYVRLRHTAGGEVLKPGPYGTFRSMDQ